MKEMEMMIGGSVGIETPGIGAPNIHTRFSINSGVGKAMANKIRSVNGVSAIGGVPADRYRMSIHIGDLYTFEEVLPQIKAIIAKYAPREYI